MKAEQKFNNIVVKNESREMGRRIMNAWKKLGVNTCGYAGDILNHYYGILENDFGSYLLEHVNENIATIMTIGELEAMANDNELPTTNDEAVFEFAMIHWLKSKGYKIFKPNSEV